MINDYYNTVNSTNGTNNKNNNFTVTVQKEDAPMQQVHEKKIEKNSNNNYHKVSKTNKLFVKKTKSTSTSTS